MEMLRLLLEGPKGPSRLCQSLGLNFYRFLEFAKRLESAQVISKQVQEGHELYFLTPLGVQLLEDWERVWNTLGQALILGK
jgi:predicted transcriptional regulator